MPKPKYNHPFIKFVRHECRRYGVKFMLRRVDGLKGEEEEHSCGGYFNDDPPELAVATRILYTDFLSSLVHEYCHMIQWAEKSPYFIHGYRGLDSWDIMERWIDGEDFKKTTVKKCIDNVRDCELVCERRAVKILKEFKIPINTETYCQRAGAYIYFHNFIKLSRRWEYKSVPTHVDGIVNAMPPNLDGDYSSTPRKIMKLFRKHMH